MTQDGPEAARKGQPRLTGHLYLIDAVELVLDRVFDGDDLAFDVVDMREPGIEGSRFAPRRGTEKMGIVLEDKEGAPTKNDQSSSPQSTPSLKDGSRKSRMRKLNSY